METQKIVNLLGDADNESSKFATRKCKLSMIKITQTMVKEMKIVQLLNLKPKSSQITNQVFVIIQTHIYL